MMKKHSIFYHKSIDQSFWDRLRRLSEYLNVDDLWHRKGTNLYHGLWQALIFPQERFFGSGKVLKSLDANSFISLKDVVIRPD